MSCCENWTNDICGQYKDELLETCKRMTAPGKGLLAADESTGTIKKRFDVIGVENTFENRRQYRQMLFKSKDFEKYISGVIMYDETLFQKTDEGVDFTKFLTDKGVLPGIKVDEGKSPLYGSGKESTTHGLKGLIERCQKYYKQGARFAKWRSELWIGKCYPTELAVEQGAQGLARYAAICQANGLVPIVEPEIMVLTGDHSIDCSYRVTKKVLSTVFRALCQHNVDIERMILKPNMVLAGRDCKKQPSPEEIANLTVKCLMEVVPPAIQGIMFLSGGQTEKEAVDNLNNLNKLFGDKPKPWELTFSYGRGLQKSALAAWVGKKENIEAGQKAFLTQAELCFKAALGKL